MTGDPLIQRLLNEILESHRTPEQVCAAFPELLTEVRRRWAQMQGIQVELDAWFPAPDPGRGPDAPSGSPPHNDLPQSDDD